MDIMYIEKSDVEAFLDKLTNRTNSSAIGIHWDCLRVPLKDYDIHLFRQSGNAHGVTKYCCGEISDTIRNAYFSIAITDSKTEYNLEVVLSDDLEHIYEVPFLNELQDKLESLYKAIDASFHINGIYKTMRKAFEESFNY